MTVSEAPQEITIHSSWRGIIGSLAGGLLVLAIGLINLVYAGVGVASIGFGVVGAVVTLGLLLDYPIASTFTADGVTRRMLLRRQQVEWDDVRQLSRTRSGGMRRSAGMTLGGLVAIVGRRRYLLVDQAESGDEHDDLEALLGERAAALEIDLAMRPSSDTAPTWLYRRRRWRQAK